MHRALVDTNQLPSKALALGWTSVSSCGSRRPVAMGNTNSLLDAVQTGLCAKARKSAPMAQLRAALLQKCTPETIKDLARSYGRTLPQRMLLGEFMALLGDPRLCDGTSIGGVRPTRKQALEAFADACGAAGSGRLHPAYSIPIGEPLVKALGACGATLLHPKRCTVDGLRRLAQDHAHRSQGRRLFLGEYLSLLADSRLDDGLGRPTDAQARAAFCRACGCTAGRLHPSYTISLEQLATALTSLGFRFVYPKLDTAPGAGVPQPEASLRSLMLTYRSPPRLFLAEYLALVEDPRVVAIGDSSKPKPSGPKARAAFALACGNETRIHPAYTLSVEQTARALEECGLRLGA